MSNQIFARKLLRKVTTCGGFCVDIKVFSFNYKKKSGDNLCLRMIIPREITGHTFDNSSVVDSLKSRQEQLSSLKSV